MSKSFMRLLLFKILKEGFIPPSERTTSEEYNALVDRVNDINTSLFVSGYDLMAVAIPNTRMRVARVMAKSSYVPESEYEALESKVSEIESFLNVNGGQIMQIKATDEGEEPPLVLPHVDGQYVTKEEFDELAVHIDDIEKMLTLTANNFIAVRS